jgi:ubiquinone/menaquinone biosynthesis C-methylase UbiE
MKNLKAVVREGYDKLSMHYRDHYKESHADVYLKWIEAFASVVPKATSVLELGCGDGVPVAQALSTGYAYTGVDLSPVQIANARSQIPAATFVVADMTELAFPDETFRGIIALYSIIHVPLDEQEALLRLVYRWLQPDGYFLTILGTAAWTGTEENWILPGVTMYWSHTNAATYCKWFKDIGFEWAKEEIIAEEGGSHTLFLLRKPA